MIYTDDEEEYEEAGSGNRFLGFMFGNVDNSGDLDADYLDEVIITSAITVTIFPISLKWIQGSAL